MAEGKIIAVWGSPNSGKTTFATKLATSIYSSFESTVITLFCDLETPVLPVLFPFHKTEELGSVGVPLSKTEVEQGDIISNLVTVKDMQNLLYCEKGFCIQVNNIRLLAILFDALLGNRFIQLNWQSILSKGHFLRSKDGKRFISASSLSSALSAAEK